MLYIWFPNLNPLIISFVICPIIAVLIGLLFTKFKKNIYVGLIIAVILPLLFIANNLETLKVNIDAWMIYGIVYGIITFAVYRIRNSSTKPN